MKCEKIREKLSKQQILDTPKLSKLKGGNYDNEPMLW